MASLTYSAQQLTPPSPISSARPMDDTPFTLVDTRTALEGLCAAVRGCDAVAVDLEHHSLRSFQGFTCLMQVAHSNRGVEGGRGVACITRCGPLKSSPV